MAYRTRHQALDRAIDVLKMGRIYPHPEDQWCVKQLEKLQLTLLKKLSKDRERQQNKKENQNAARNTEVSS
jgi:hypothetical protein